jgi:hypothetical protein
MPSHPEAAAAAPRAVRVLRACSCSAGAAAAAASLASCSLDLWGLRHSPRLGQAGAADLADASAAAVPGAGESCCPSRGRLLATFHNPQPRH